VKNRGSAVDDDKFDSLIVKRLEKQLVAGTMPSPAFLNSSKASVVS
jgi:hypothetical protein